jgi:hypothetical protein
VNYVVGVDIQITMMKRNDTFALKKRDEDEIIKQYHAVRDRISIVDGLLMYAFEDKKPRFIIPIKMRSSILNTFHAAHQGAETISRRARQTVYWPHLDKDIERACGSCKLCIENSPSNSKEELIITETPDYPFQKTVSDLFSHEGHHYLVYADRLTGWPEVEYFQKDPASPEVLGALRKWFRCWGVPEELAFDGGPNISKGETTAFYGALVLLCMHNMMTPLCICL